MTKGRSVALAVCGSIAAYKAVIVARELIGHGVAVTPLMTESAAHFVGPLTLSGICGRGVVTDMFDPGYSGEVHVDLGQSVDLVLIVPATADVLARLAAGRADDIVTALALSAKCPVLVAPAMHARMWHHPATQRNVATLMADGRVQLVGPEEGPLASGEVGMGRLADPEDIVTQALMIMARRSDGASSVAGAAKDGAPRSGAPAPMAAAAAPLQSGIAPAGGSAPLRAPAAKDGSPMPPGIAAIAASLAATLGQTTGSSPAPAATPEPAVPARPPVDRDLAGFRIVVTAGPTVEDLDPVRFLSNRSTGRMGFAVAERAALRGALVTLVSGPVELATPAGVTRVDVRSAREMKGALDSALSAGPGADALVMTAAVADYAPREVQPHKLKKAGDAITLELVKNPDLLADVGQARSGVRPVLVGFAVETADPDILVAYAQKKLREKKVDLIVANPAAEAFASDTNRATFVSENAEEALQLMSKSELADEILDRVRALFATRDIKPC